MAKKNRHRKSNSDSMVEINSSESSDDRNPPHPHPLHLY